MDPTFDALFDLAERFTGRVRLGVDLARSTEGGPVDILALTFLVDTDVIGKSVFGRQELEAPNAPTLLELLRAAAVRMDDMALQALDSDEQGNDKGIRETDDESDSGFKM